MSILRKILGGLVLVILVAFAGWHVYNAAQLPGLKAKNTPPVDFANLPLVPKPNQAIVAPSTLQIKTEKPVAEPMPSPVFAQTAVQVSDTLVKIATAEPRTEVLYTSEDGMKLTLLQQTAVMRYPDFVSVELLQRDDGYSEIAMYSRSVYGYGDIGVNGKRVERWLAKLNTDLPPPAPKPAPAAEPAAAEPAPAAAPPAEAPKN
jgi:uncharacterized protein (DUF1499 family)